MRGAKNADLPPHSDCRLAGELVDEGLVKPQIAVEAMMMKLYRS